MNLRFRNCHRLTSWYVQLSLFLPGCIQPWYIESARVGYDCHSFCRFGWKGRK